MDGTGESLPRAPIPAWREHTNGRSRNAWRAHKKDSVAGGHRMNAQDCSGRVEMEGGAMSAKYTQVDGTGNHIKVLDAQSTLVEWAFPAISAAMPSHPCSLFTASLAHVSATTPRMGAPGASRPLARSEKGSRQKLLCGGAGSTRSPATKLRSRVDAILRTRRPAIPIGRAPAGLIKASKP
ncbi:hypothetical protein FP744_10003988 [Trichoderma asperellum]